MDINQIYTTIFPIGGIDDNNRYIKLNGMQINTIQLLEPAIKVNQMGVSKKDMSDQNNMKDKYGYRIPMISIDGNMLEPVNITYFKLDYRGFLPLVTVDFVDPGNEQLSTIVIKDGSIVSVYIGGYGDELYYKPIRQDFIITEKRLGVMVMQHLCRHSLTCVYILDSVLRRTSQKQKLLMLWAG